MNYEAEFDDYGMVTWVLKPPKPVDLRRFQGAMFTDRIDLWLPAKKPGSARTRPLPGQPTLKLNTEEREE